jgi:uncharacterized protein YbjT (DUF2867 family)
VTARVASATQRKIVVAGGTGFVGRHIVRELIDSGHQVAVLSRNPLLVSSLPELVGASAIQADVTEPKSLAGTLEGAHVVVGAVQFPNHPVEVPRRGLTYDRYDRLGTENLLAEATRAGVSSYIYVSGAGADPASSKTWYRAKGRAEDAIRRSGLRFAILRPSWGYGRGDRALNRFAAIARFSPVLPRIGVRPQRIQPVHAGDIALAVRRTLEVEDSWNRIYEIGGPQIMTMDDILRTLLEVMGKRRLILPVPTPVVKLATAPLVLLPNPPMTPHGIEFAVQDGVVDNTELEKVLDVHPVGLREGLSRYLVT